MEIKQEFKSVPKPSLKSIGPGKVFVVDEKGLHDFQRVAYMRVKPASLDQAFDLEVPVIRLDSGDIVLMRLTRQVTPVEAVLTLEVPFG